MTASDLINKLRNQPDSISFDEVIQHIQTHYDYTPAEFSNGEVINQAGTNEGSCKIFAFARLEGLSEPETLACFGDYYRNDVLKHPDGEDHANIRSFIKHGWSGITFKNQSLSKK